MGLAGDEQADPTVHGGPGKAVYAYPFEHYAFWRTVRSQAKVEGPMEPGAVGENLLVEGLLEPAVFVGDRLVIGDVELRIERPRSPCFKFNARMGFGQAVKLMVAECCRNLGCTGATPVGATNNLNFGNPERPEIMAQIVEAIEGMAEACEFFETPITGGNVSLYNETLGDPIYPSPVMGIVGLMKTQAPAGIAFREAGRDLYLIGGIGEADEVRMGGTQYAKQVVKDIWGLPPALDMEFEKKVQTAVREMVATAAVESAHDISDGGLAWCLAESTFGRQVGAQVELDSSLRPELLLYHEGPSRVVVSTSDAAAVEKIAAECGVPAVKIGVTAENELVIRNRGEVLIQTEVRGLKEGWSGALENLLHAEVHA